jgi:hypothetical protein
MNLGTIVSWSFFISLVLVLLGAFMKILHLPGAEQLLIVGMVTNGVFVIAALSEVWRSERIDKNEKIMWTIAFIFMGVFRHHCRNRLFVAWQKKGCIIL